MKTGRVPNYKSIALAILNNDLEFHTLGFARKENELTNSLYRDLKRKKSAQMELFK
jgi:predicted phosphoadenosine phosphosulfate sulfurtransferase